MDHHNMPGLKKPGNTMSGVNKSHLDFISESISEGLIFIDNNFQISYASPFLLVQNGFKDEFFHSPNDLLELVYRRDLVIALRELRFAIERQKATCTFTYRYKSPGGILITRTDSLKIRYDESGRFDSGIIMVRPQVTGDELKKAAEEANDRLRNLAATVPGILYQVKLTPEGMFSLLYASEGLSEILDFQLEALLEDAAPLFEKIHGDDRPEFLNSIHESYRNLTEWKAEFRVQFSSGIIKWIWASSRPQKQCDGAVIWNGFMMDISDRKEAELLSRKKDDQLKKLSASLPGIIYQFRMCPDGKLTMPYASEGLYALYGVSWDEVKQDANKIFTSIHPEDFQGMMTSILSSYQHLTNWQHEFRVVFNDGTIKNISGSSVPQREADGSVLWNGFLMDITDRKKIELDARQKEEQLKRIASQVPGAILQFRLKPDLSISIPFANTGFENIFGLKTEDVKNDAMPFFDLVMPEAKKKVEADMFASLENKAPWMEVYPMRLPDGAVHLMAGNSIPEMEEDGSVLWTGFITDVTRQREAEETIRQSDARFKNMFQDHSAVMLLIEPQTGKIENANDAASGYYGYSHEQLCSMNISEINMTDKQELFNLRQQTLIAAPGPLVFKHRLANGNQRFVEVSSSPVDFGDRRMLYAIVHDVTAKKEAEEKLRSQAIELKTSNQDLENFAHLASHDLKEPLRMVTNFLGLLEKRIGAKLDEKDRQYFHFATDGANRMKVLISDLLHYSRIGSNKERFVMVDFNKAVQYNLKVLAESISEKNAVVVTHTLPIIAANHTLINELYLNLLNNALNYCKDSPHIEIGYELRSDDHCFYVKDNGIGISPDYHEKIFEMFQRLHSRDAYSGTGIGLALCKRIADAHQGKIWVNSEVDKGSTFWFSIPTKLDQKLNLKKQ